MDFRDFLSSPPMWVLFWPGFILAFLNSLAMCFFGADIIEMAGSVHHLLSPAGYFLTVSTSVVLVVLSLYLAYLAFVKGEGGDLLGKNMSAGLLLFLLIWILGIFNPLNWALIGFLGIDLPASAFAFFPLLARVLYLAMALVPGLFLLYLMRSEG